MSCCKVKEPVVLGQSIYVSDYRLGFDCRIDLLTTYTHHWELQKLTELLLHYTLRNY
jgi:hypothetical protein